MIAYRNGECVFSRWCASGANYDVMAKTISSQSTRKIQPKLRMIRNGSSDVNCVRAEHAASVAASSKQTIRQIGIVRDETSAPHLREDLGKGATRGKLKSVPSDILVNVFVGIDSRASDSTKIPGETNRRGNLATACVKLSDLDSLAAQPGVSHIELGEPIDVPRPSSVQAVRLRRRGECLRTHRVLVIAAARMY